MKFICPTIGEDHEKDFLVTGSLDDFKIIVFSDLDEYEKGFVYMVRFRSARLCRLQ